MEIPSLRANLTAFQLLLVDLGDTEQVEQGNCHRDEEVQEMVPTRPTVHWEAQPCACQCRTGQCQADMHLPDDGELHPAPARVSVQLAHTGRDETKSSESDIPRL